MGGGLTDVGTWLTHSDCKHVCGSDGPILSCYKLKSSQLLCSVLQGPN